MINLCYTSILESLTFSQVNVRNLNFSYLRYIDVQNNLLVLLLNRDRTMIKQFTLAKTIKSTSVFTGLILATFCSLPSAIAGEGMQPSKTDMETETIKSHKHETSMSEEKMNLVETAMGAGDFKILVTAVKAAGLVETLSGEDKFTVFAPTDKAFAALGEEKLKELLKPENKDKLVGILTYHVVPGVVKSSDLETGEVKTVEGSPVEIELGKSVKVNEAMVIKADIETSNGIIHVIDKVILPPKK